MTKNKQKRETLTINLAKEREFLVKERESSLKSENCLILERENDEFSGTLREFQSLIRTREFCQKIQTYRIYQLERVQPKKQPFPPKLNNVKIFFLNLLQNIQKAREKVLIWAPLYKRRLSLRDDKNIKSSLSAQKLFENHWFVNFVYIHQSVCLVEY